MHSATKPLRMQTLRRKENQVKSYLPEGLKDKDLGIKASHAPFSFLSHSPVSS